MGFPLRAVARHGLQKNGQGIHVQTIFLLTMLCSSQSRSYDIHFVLRHRPQIIEHSKNCTDILIKGNYTLIVHNGVMLDRGAVLLPSCKVIIDAAGGCCVDEKDWFQPGIHEIEVGQHVADTVVLARHSHDTTFWHLTFQLLPRLEAMIREDFVFEHVAVYAPATAASYLPHYFTNATYVYDDPTNKTFQRLFLPPSIQEATPFAPASFERLSKTIDGDLPARNHVVVISRQGVGRREMANRAELLDGLQARLPKLKLVSFGERGALTSIAHTASVFRGACGVVGVHGAGLTNACFMERPGFIMEIRPMRGCCSTIGDVYPLTAKTCGHQYHLHKHGRGLKNDAVDMDVPMLIDDLMALLPNSTCLY